MKSDFDWYHANGKLMLFGEYVVMRGVPAMAFPTKMGQSLHVSKSNSFLWESFELNNLWFYLKFNAECDVLDTNIPSVADKLMLLFKDIKFTRPDLFEDPLHFEIHSNFNRNWGFGSSATLVSLLSQWSEMNPYTLNDRHFGGSGYDIACATARGPILYDQASRKVENFELAHAISDQLLFIYSGNKQNSQREVTAFKGLYVSNDQLSSLNNLVLNSTQAVSIEQFESIIDTHESVLSDILNRPPLKQLEFADYPHSIKSLGAWGGDFFMATFKDLNTAKSYFKEKQKSIFFSYKDLIL